MVCSASASDSRLVLCPRKCAGSLRSRRAVSIAGSKIAYFSTVHVDNDKDDDDGEDDDVIIVIVIIVFSSASSLLVLS